MTRHAGKHRQWAALMSLGWVISSESRARVVTATIPPPSSGAPNHPPPPPPLPSATTHGDTLSNDNSSSILSPPDRIAATEDRQRVEAGTKGRDPETNAGQEKDEATVSEIERMVRAAMASSPEQGTTTEQPPPPPPTAQTSTTIGAIVDPPPPTAQTSATMGAIVYPASEATADWGPRGSKGEDGNGHSVAALPRPAPLKTPTVQLATQNLTTFLSGDLSSPQRGKVDDTKLDPPGRLPLLSEPADNRAKNDENKMNNQAKEIAAAREGREGAANQPPPPPQSVPLKVPFADIQPPPRGVQHKIQVPYRAPDPQDTQPQQQSSRPPMEKSTGQASSIQPQPRTQPQHPPPQSQWQGTHIQHGLTPPQDPRRVQAQQHRQDPPRYFHDRHPSQLPRRPHGPQHNQHQYQMGQSGHATGQRRQPLVHRPHRPHQPQPPIWKRLWKRVEGGLDSLADLEDGFAGRASKLYAATLETASTAIHKLPHPHKIPSAEKRQDVMVEEDSDNEPEQVVVPAFRLPAAQGTTTPSQQSNHQAENSPGNRPVSSHGSMRPEQTNDAMAGGSVPVALPEKRPDVVGPKQNRPILAAGGASSFPEGGNNGTSPPHQATSSPQSIGGQPLPSTRLPPVQTTNSAVRPPQQDTTKRQPRFTPTTQRPPSRPKPSAQPTSLKYDDEKSWRERIGSLIPPMPSFKFLRFRQGSFGDYATTMDAWSAEDDEKESSRRFLGVWKRKKPAGPHRVRSSPPKYSQSPAVTATVGALMERCEEKTLLNPVEKKKFVSLGRRRGFLDFAALLVILYISKEFGSVDLVEAGRSATSAFEAFAAVARDLLKGEVPYALSGAVLLLLTNHVVVRQAGASLARSVGEQVYRDSQYGALFLRLTTSVSTKASVVQQVKTASRAQSFAIMEAARLGTFVVCLLATLVAATLSFVTPILVAASFTISDILSLQEWRAWPPAWRLLGNNILYHISQLLHFAKSEVGLEVMAWSEQPLRFAYEASLFVGLLLIAQLPRWEMMKLALNSTSGGEEDDEDAPLKLGEKASNLGVSSATRLQLLAKGASLDELLERSAGQPTKPQEAATVRPLLSFVSSGVVGGLLLALPILIYAKAGILGELYQRDNLMRWDSVREVAFVLICTQGLFLSALGRAVDASMTKSLTAGFLSRFASAAQERTKQLSTSPANLQVQASISPVAGLMVRDLWVAHAAKRAWGIRGASFFCRNGEVVVVLGEDGSGKSRLLTTVAESIFTPAKQAQTATRVRGSVSVGGLDVSKWVPRQLRKRVGLMLNDVRTVADFSNVLAGMTLEEILEPSDSHRLVDPTHNPGSSARASMMLALKMTGLYSTLLPRLQLKLATVVTANEDDLSPSPLRPHYTILSPAEWSKLLLARVLCQAIYDNESAAGTNDKIEKSLMGSVLLLDDVAAQFSESDEGRLVRDLRSSSAATVLTSTRWALGRWADRVVVLKDGAVLESGTHNELLGRGPQQSLYAAKWHAMTAT